MYFILYFWCIRFLIMKLPFLFPTRYKSLGWIIFFPTLILGFLTVLYDWEPSWLDVKFPTLYYDPLIFGSGGWFKLVEINILNDLLGVLMIISGLFVGFSRLEDEDEYISKLRLESLVWSVYANYLVLLFAFLFVNGMSFVWVMIFNMYTILFFFIIRFHWKLYQFKNSVYEE